MMRHKRTFPVALSQHSVKTQRTSVAYLTFWIAAYWIITELQWL